MHDIIAQLLNNHENNKRLGEQEEYLFFDLEELKNSQITNELAKTTAIGTRLIGKIKKDLVAIDGGSAPILLTPIVCVLYVRIAAYATTKPKITLQEGTILATYDAQNTSKETITVTFFEEKKKKEKSGQENKQENKEQRTKKEELFSIRSKELEGDSTLLQAANIGRKILEWRLAKKEQETRKESLVIWDGSFDTQTSIEKKELPCVLGIAKSSQIEKNWMQFNKKGVWFARKKEDTNIVFAKLHSQSKVIVRINECRCENCKQKNINENKHNQHSTQEEELANKLIELLAWSCDPVFLGYPYPLIVADQLARISNEEAKNIKTRLQLLANKDWDKISFGSQESHSILDNIKF